MKFSIVIPVYNEKETILNILKLVKAVPLPPEITAKLIIDTYKHNPSKNSPYVIINEIRNNYDYPITEIKKNNEYFFDNKTAGYIKMTAILIP